MNQHRVLLLHDISSSRPQSDTLNYGVENVSHALAQMVALITLFGSLILGLTGETQAMFAWWIAIALLLPPLLWALRSSNLALTVICAITFITQFVTVPLFYLYREAWHLKDVKEYQFSGIEALPMLMKVFLFIIALILFFHVLNLFVYRSIRRIPQIKPPSRLNSSFGVTTLSAGLYTILLIIIVFMMVPLRYWMFLNGIGMTGIEPPRLPFRLTGFLFILTSYLIPFLIGLLYWKTTGNVFISLLVLGFGLFSGLTATSRGVAIFIMMPVVIKALVDRRFLLFGVSTVWSLISFSVISQLRNVVHLISNGKPFANTIDIDLAHYVFEFSGNFFSSFSEQIPRLIYDTISRIEGFESLVLSKHYDGSQVPGGNAEGLILRMISRSLREMDADAHHLQWQGYTLPEGWYNGGQLLSDVVIAGNEGWWWIIIFAFVAAVLLFSMEALIKKVVLRYKLSPLIYPAVTFVLCLFFFTDRGQITVTYPLLILLVLTLLPRGSAFNSLLRTPSDRGRKFIIEKVLR